ncbi:thioesterase domain-containing protein [Amycolatopsis mediterranei]|uniref:thioesterase II family protein n=1 Tax=Amycolatopsis mediterranei TaxID=33910 RepID=UPI0034153A08
MTTPWFPYPPAAPPRPLRLFCLPPAGGGASGYRTWIGAFGPDVEVVPVQLPGRENRLHERPAGSAAELADRLVAPVLGRAGDRFAVFGHSMGAILAHDLTHRLCAAGRPPEHLIVSAHRAPQLAARRRWDRPAAEMSGDDLRGYLADRAGTPREVLDLPELMDLVLPVLRADLALCQSYQDTARTPLPVPLSAFGGADDPEAGAGELAAWSDRTSAGFRMRLLAGGHGYLFEDVPAVHAALRAALADPPKPRPVAAGSS